MIRYTPIAAGLTNYGARPMMGSAFGGRRASYLPAEARHFTSKGDDMSRLFHAIACAALAATFLTVPAQAQQQRPAFETTRVEGTDNVYIFRYQNHQSMFVVTPAGVIATDPIGHARPQAVQTYIDEIRKVTKAPIRYVVYSHQHFDHIAGGKPFKDQGARFIAHKRAKEHLVAMKHCSPT